MFTDFVNATTALNRSFEHSFNNLGTLDALSLINRQCTGSGNTSDTYFVKVLSLDYNKLKFYFLKNLCFATAFMLVDDKYVYFFDDDKHLILKNVRTNFLKNSDVVVFDKTLPFIKDVLELINNNPDTFNVITRRGRIGTLSQDLPYYKTSQLIESLINV